MNRILFTAFIILFSVVVANAQQWRTMQSNGKTFFEIKKAMDVKFAGKSARKGAPNYSREMKQYKRWEYFWRSQVDASGRFPTARTVYKGYREALKLETKSSTKGANWVFMGPSAIPQSTSPDYAGLGRVNAIALHPVDSNIIWVGSPSGGIWKSTDGGSTWVPKGDNLPVMGVSDIAIDPNNTNTMYIVTGDADGGHNNSVGLLKSTDGGNSWNTTGLTFIADSGFQASKILISPANSSHLLVSTSKGIYKSTDGGNSFSKVYNHAADQLSLKYGSNSVVYASARPAKMLKSTDFGSTWTVLTSLSNAWGSRIAFGLTPANSNLIIAVDDVGIARKSTDGGSSWSNFSVPSQFDTQGGYNMIVQISPSNANLILIGGVNGWRSTNGGSTWELYLNGYWFPGDPYFYIHSDMHVIKMAPWDTSLFFVGNDGGLFKGRLTQTNAWTDLSTGLQITQFYNLGCSAKNPNLVIAGAQDNDVGYFNGTNWLNVNNCSDGIDGLINFNNSNIQYAASQEGYLAKTTNSWQTDTDISVSSAYGAAFVWPIDMDPVNPDIIYAGYDDIYRSANGGSSWTNLTNGLTNGGYYQDISVSPSNPSVIYAIDETNNVYKTNNITSWSNVISNPVQYVLINRICVSPSNPDVVYLVFAGYTSGKKVYKSVDGGLTWTNISAGLPNVPINCIVAQSGTNEDLYVGTSVGVYYKNKNTSWTAYNTGLPKVIVNDLEIQYGSSKLRAATYGRGVWQTDLATPVGINTVIEKNPVSVSPNPSKGVFRVDIDVEDFNGYKLEVYNVIGGVVYKNDRLTGSFNIDLSSLPDGMYFVSLVGDNRVYSKKIIINK